MAGAPRLHGKKWEVRWSFQGRKWTHREEFENDAKLAREYISALGDRILPDDPRLVTRAFLRGQTAPIRAADKSFLDVAQAYARTKTWSASRARSYANTIRNHYADWADLPVERITDDLLNEKYHALRAATWQSSPKSAPKPYARNTIINIMDQALQVLTFAHFRGLLGDVPNPAKSPYLAFNRTMTRPPNRVPFRASEFRAILDLVREHCPAVGRRAVRETQHADTIAVMVALGVRIGEVLALAVKDVDLIAKVVWVGHTIERGMAGDRRKGTKSGEHLPPRPVAVDDDFCDFIGPIVEGRPGDAPLFPGVRDGKFQHPDEWRSTIWTPMVKMAMANGDVRDDIDHVPHVTRYSMVAFMRRHARTRDIADRVGHESEKTTTHYFANEEDLEAQREAMKGLPKGIYA
jgi:integrase